MNFFKTSTSFLIICLFYAQLHAQMELQFDSSINTLEQKYEYLFDSLDV
ncbi:MAG: hypothetical protein ACJAZ3_000985 [Sphingobacteriales bacterium]|jgi:hypothetical protein